MAPSRGEWGWIVGLFALSCALFWPATRFGFVLIDDPQYVTENPYVAAGLGAPGLRFALQVGYAGNWHPLTWISHMLDVSLFGLRPGPHHRTNVLLHAVNACLVFWALRRLGRPSVDAAERNRLVACAGLVAAVFAVHPCRIESVAWVSERKDLLSALFGLVAVLAWIRYRERGGAGRYLAVLGALAAGLLAKPMLVTWPLLFLLLDLGPLRHRRAAGGKRAAAVPWVPFALLVAASSAITLFAQQRGGAMAGLKDSGAVGRLSLFDRLANAIVAYAAYVADFLWPAGRSVLYPLPQHGWPAWLVLGSAGFLLGITALVWRLAPRRPHAALGWAWFLIGLVPVIGVIQVGHQARADRYTYLTQVGLCIALLPGVRAFGSWRPTLRATAWAVSVLAVTGLTLSTRAQLPAWHDSEALFSRALEVTSRNYFAHDGLALALWQEGRPNEALIHAEQAVRINPAYLEARLRLVSMLLARGREAEAVERLREGLRIHPGEPRLRDALERLLGRGAG